jgi:hypothetical protein
MRSLTLACAIAATILGGTEVPGFQAPAIRTVDERTLREYTGVYQWGQDAFVYL